MGRGGGKGKGGEGAIDRQGYDEMFGYYIIYNKYNILYILLLYNIYYKYTKMHTVKHSAKRRNSGEIASALLRHRMKSRPTFLETK